MPTCPAVPNKQPNQQPNKQPNKQPNQQPNQQPDEQPEQPNDKQPQQANERPAPKNMDRWLGDGGMPIVGALGCSLNAYGADHGGWVEGTWVPTELACNPYGIVHGGVYGVVHDALMNFAVNAGLPGKDRARATLDLKIELLRSANAGDNITLRGVVVRQAKLVAYAEARVTNDADELISRATALFALQRAQ
jgi:uncharacterized protein (TIGR00369 family)